MLYDIIAHVILAIFVPGHWWFQFLPDICNPILFSYTMLTDKLVDERNWLLRLHRFMHSLWLPLLSMFAYIVTRHTMILWLAVHWWCHVGVDYTTHPQKELKKKLL